MANLAVEIAGIKLKNPVMVASGTFGYAREYEGLLDFDKLGAIITKTITLKPKEGNPPPRICETASGMLNAIGLQNNGVEYFVKEYLPYIKKLATPVIVSIGGETVEEYAEIAARLDKEVGIQGLEINISCPNVKAGGMLFGQDPKLTAEVISAVRKSTTLPLIAKLTPNVADITLIAKAAVEAGADALALINTLLGIAIDIETRKPKLGSTTGGLSGPAIKPVAVRMVYEVYQTVKVPLIGMGGIMSAEDAIEFILAGATAVAIGTANFVDPKTAEKVIEGINKYLETHKIADINHLIGKISS